MKKALFPLFIIIFLSLIVEAQSNPDKDLFLTKSLAKETISKVYARTSGGSIDVTGISTGETRLEVYVRANNAKNNTAPSKEELQRRLDEDYELSISVTNNQLEVVAKKKNKNLDWKKQLNISFQVFVSSAISTNLQTSGGGIHLSNLSGTQNFSTSGGNLDLDKLTGNINGKTSGGSIRVSNSSNDIYLKTSGGSIKASNCKGNIHLFTSGGSLSFNNLDGTIEAKTSGGSIHGNNIKGELTTHTSGGGIDLQEMAGSIDASTSGGNIEVGLTQLGKHIKLSTSSGSIDLQMPDKQGLNLNLHASKIKTNALTNFNGTKEEDEINGTLNGGGIPVSVKAVGGRIAIDFK